MANNIVNKTVNIYIQSGEAQKALDALIKKETQLKLELEKATNPKVVERLKTELQRLEEPIDRARKKLSGELSPSLKDVQTTVNNLGNSLKRLSSEDADFEPVLKQWREGNAQLDQQKQKVGLLRQAMNSFWKEAKTVAVGVIIGSTVESMLQTVMGYVTGMVTGSAKIADELADIEKTTGLTGEEVKQLNSELSKIDTRTSSAELRQLAAEGGKLGKETVQDVKKFVEEADKIKVALGEDLGEDAIISIGKLSKIFKVEMLNIGSAVNEIGANSEASERFAVDFLNRLAGTGPAAKLSADQLLGYSAALEINGQTAEVSGTALSTFFIEFVRDSEKFGKAAGFAKGELTALINEKGTNAGFLTFLEKLKAANPDAQQFLSKLQDLGVDGSRGANVMLALSNNIGLVREQQDIANKAIQSNSSIMAEFNKKNNNAAAELDKLKKNFASLFSSDTIMEGGAAAVRILNNFINVLKGIPAFIRENRSAIALLITGIALLNSQYIISAVVVAKDSVVKAYNIVVTRAIAIGNNIAAAATAAHSLVVAAFTGRLSLATAAAGGWRIALSTVLGPLGILTTAIGVAIIACNNLFSSTKKLTAEQQLSADIQSRVAESIGATVAEVELLRKALENENLSYAEKEKALARLIEINPDFVNTLKLNKDGTVEGTAAIGDYINALKTKAEAEAKYALFQEKSKKKAELLNKFRSNVPGSEKFTDQQLDDAFDKNIRSLPGTLENDDVKEYIATRKQLKILGDDYSTFSQQIKNATDNSNKLTGGIANIGNQLDETKKKTKAAKDDLEKLAEELKEIANELTGNKLSEDQRELLQLDLKYEKLRERAKGNNKLLLEIERLHQEEFFQLVDKQSKRHVEAFKKEDAERRKLAEDRRKEQERLDALKKLPVKLEGSALALHEILGRDKVAKAELDALKKHGKERLDAEQQLLNIQREKELENTSLLESEKEVIREKYRQKELDLQLQFLQSNLKLALDFASQTLAIFSFFGNAKTEKENAELARDKAINDKKKDNLQKRLKSGALSQAEYDRQVQKIEKEQEKREKEVRIKQFKRDQRAQVVQALMSGANAVVSTLAARPGSLDIISLGAFRAINIGLAVAATAAQVAAIASKKPPEYGRGGTLLGRSHAQGGMGVYDHLGRKQAELEGGEMIGSKKTANDKRRYNVSGTPSEIFSLLNGVNGGVTWESGAVLHPGWSTQRPMPMNFAAVSSSLASTRRYYADGGKFGEEAAAPSSGSSTHGQEMAAVFSGMMATLDRMNATLASLQAYGVTANVSLGSLEDAQKRKQAIIDAGTMR